MAWTIIKQNPMPSGIDQSTQVWYIHNMELSGVGSKIYIDEKERTVAHFVRHESRKLWKFLESTVAVHKPTVVLNVKGDPGAGKSTTCFGWLGFHKTNNNAKVCFITQRGPDYVFTTLDYKEPSKRRASIDEFESIVAEAAADIYVLSNFKNERSAVDHVSCAVRAIIENAEYRKAEKVTIVLCSSHQVHQPNMQHIESHEYSFINRWTMGDLIACRNVAKSMNINILQLKLLASKEKFVARASVAGGNMRYMCTDDTEVRAEIDWNLARMSMRSLIDGECAYSHPDIYNPVFVHISEKQVRLLSEYVEEKICTRILNDRVLCAMMLDPNNNAFPDWLLKIRLQVVFAHAQEFNHKVVFRKPSVLLLWPSTLKFRVNRIVKYGPIPLHITDWFVSDNEATIFLPGTSNQTLFNSICVMRAGDLYRVYFFQETVGKTHTFLFAHGGYFLATLFPDFLSHEVGGSTAAPVKIKSAAVKRQKEPNESFEKDEENNIARRSSAFSTNPHLSGLDASEDTFNEGPSGDVVRRSVCLPQTEPFSPIPPLANRVNRPKRIELHFYVITNKDRVSSFSVNDSVDYDIEYMQQFDNTFVKEKIRVVHME